MAIGKTFIQILGPNEPFPYNPGFVTIFLKSLPDVSRSAFGFTDQKGNVFSSFLNLEQGNTSGNSLSKIFDVNISSPSNGQILSYNSTTNKWENSINSGSGNANIQPGLNTYTGGTATAPTVNVSALTINTITASGASNFTSISATTISAATINSGSTNLYSIFLPNYQFTSQSLTITSATTINGQGYYSSNFYASSNITATTITFSNIPDGGNVIINYLKTTSNNLVITFPSGSVVSTSSDATVTGGALVATLASTVSGEFIIQICNINGTYLVFISNVVA